MIRNIIPTSQIILGAVYKDTPTNYFQSFDNAWDQVIGQVIKLETKQVYREPGNPSYEELENGNFQKALELLPDARKEDIELYQQLSDRKVDFIRCRPVIFPISQYLKWEMSCYDFNALHGERIFFTERTKIFDEYAMHDYMVFDRKIAAIHDYDNNGELQGGWIIDNKDHIDNLIMLFSIIKASSMNYLLYMLKQGIRV